MKDTEINLALISNIVHEPYFEINLKKEFSERAKIYTIQYENKLEFTHIKDTVKFDLFCIILNFEVIVNTWRFIISEPKAEKIIDEISSYCINLCLKLEQHTNSQIILFLFEDYYTKFNLLTGNIPQFKNVVDNINSKLVAYFENTNIVCVDLKRLIANIGIANAFDIRSKYRWNAPYSKLLHEDIAKELYKQYLIEKGNTKKCLVLDCDNVLWGGILSEDNIENIKLSESGLGRAYQDFQRFVLMMYYHGVILAVCSKNDMSDVMIMFREHTGMILKEEHISCFWVNWENKPNNIRQISQQLNIGLDSIVFIDDSVIEIEAVRTILPEVTAILFDRENIYYQLSCFNFKKNANLVDIEKRNRTYQTNQLRKSLKYEYTSYSDYIDALEIKMDIHKAISIEYNRISELTQRANRCTNGKRYSVTEIIERANNDNIILYSLSVSDRFSDLGLVGAIEIERDILTLFTLSCRALGLELEKKMLEFITKKHDINKIEFYLTGKNNEIKTLLHSIVEEK